MRQREFRRCKRREFIRKLKALGFTGPYPGGKHQYMRFGTRRQTIPSNKEFSVPQLKELLKQVAEVMERAQPITPEEWEGL